MERKTPAARGGRGLEIAGQRFQAPFTIAAMQAQFIAARFNLTPDHAATVAALAFGGLGHG